MQALSEEGFELQDDTNPEDEYTEQSQQDFYLSVLTNRQQTVAKLLNEGHSRKEIAHTLNVCLQAIHQIVLRIRKRLKEKTDIEYTPKRSKTVEDEETKNILFMFYLTNPSIPAERLHQVWEVHTVLRDYNKPTLNKLRLWLEEIRKEF